ncbi:endonuclease/exonuclease/phosphatase family protein [Actinomadura sp. 3N508]|uniref:endonuclease/exonuclease/phosphatase family protein n=1 Tax=Actinomadura sp. 3N508 TaxID=3375153 RepID=UPI0037B93397
MSDTPDNHVIVRAATYNLHEGGLDGEGTEPDEKDDSRLQQQVDTLSRLDLDLIGLQEAKWSYLGNDRLKRVADLLGMTYYFLAPSNFYGCDIAVFARPGDNLTVVNTRQLTGPPWVHTLINVHLEIAGLDVHFLVGHSAPSGPTARLAEAEMAAVHRDLNVIYAADFNAAAEDDDPDTTGIDPVKAASKLDKRPARTLTANGFYNIGRICQDPIPTVGHGAPNETRNNQLAYRCDRILTTLPECVTGYGVELGADDLSDHRPVWAEFALGQ